MNTNIQKLAKILDVEENLLAGLDKEMSEKTGKKNILDKIAAENEGIIEKVLQKLNNKDHSAAHVRSILRKAIFFHEKQFLSFLKRAKGQTEFDKAANLARSIARIGKGFFLKKEYAKEILKKSKPNNLLRYLNCATIDDLLKEVDITEAFSALRFVESNEWMHKTFEDAYSNFTADDFEERDIEIKVLGPKWFDIAKKFVAKKHHNVSHLKEFGVIFLNPIKVDIPGKFLRDFALLLHYFHEIEFYSKLFRKYAKEDDFAKHLKFLLRGDVIDKSKANDRKSKFSEWLIVQRYLWKEDPKDPRLSLIRVNPESVHWARGERDLAEFGKRNNQIDLDLWGDMDWVGNFFKGDFDEELISFDLEDNAMSLVSFMEGKEEYFNYHQKEAMWTKIFSEYVGGEENLEKLVIDNFDKGVIEIKRGVNQ